MTYELKSPYLLKYIASEFCSGFSFDSVLVTYKLACSYGVPSEMWD